MGLGGRVRKDKVLGLVIFGSTVAVKRHWLIIPQQYRKVGVVTAAFHTALNSNSCVCDVIALLASDVVMPAARH